MFIGKTDAEAPILWPPNVKSQVIGKDSDDGKDWRQMEKEETMRYLESITNSLNTNLRKPHEIGRQRSWVYYSPWGHKELDWLSDWTTLIISDIWLNNFLSMNKKTCYALQVFYLSVRLTVQFFFTIFQIRVNTKHLWWWTLTHSINTIVTLYNNIFFPVNCTFFLIHTNWCCILNQLTNSKQIFWVKKQMWAISSCLIELN